MDGVGWKEAYPVVVGNVCGEAAELGGRPGGGTDFGKELGCGGEVCGPAAEKALECEKQRGKSKLTAIRHVRHQDTSPHLAMPTVSLHISSTPYMP